MKRPDVERLFQHPRLKALIDCSIWHASRHALMRNLTLTSGALFRLTLFEQHRVGVAPATTRAGEALGGGAFGPDQVPERGVEHGQETKSGGGSAVSVWGPG